MGVGGVWGWEVEWGLGGVRGDTCRDAGMLICSLRVFFFFASLPSSPPHLGCTTNCEFGQCWCMRESQLRGFVCLSLEDCNRRCSLITDGADVSVQWCWSG